MMRRVVGMAVMAVLVCAMTARAAETMESVEKKIGDLNARYKSLQYNMHMVREMTIGADTSTKDAMDGQFQAVRKGGKVLSRMETKSRSTIKIAGQPEQTQEVSNLMVNDGEYMYTLTDTGANKMATKDKPDPKSRTADPLDCAAAFNAMSKDFNLKVQPDQAVDGKDAWVIEATPKDTKNPNMPLAGMVSYYDKKTGVPIKSVGYDKNGKIVNTMTISDVKINAEIPAERFVFKAPPGVEVMDRTKVAGASSMPVPPEQDDNTPEPADK